jgi:hypothetical protein
MQATTLRSPSPAHGQPTPTTEPLALAALVLAIASFVVLPVLPAVAALVVGLRANKRLNEVDDGVRGRGLLRAAMVIATLNLVAIVAVVALVSSTSSHLRARGERIVPIQSLHVGQCFNAAPGSNVLTVALVSCSHPHDHEAYAVFDDPTAAGAPWPGDEAASTMTYARCVVRFPAFVGRPYEGSSLTTFRLRPTKRTWTDQDDRRILCAVSNRGSAQLMGTARDSGR